MKKITISILIAGTLLLTANFLLPAISFAQAPQSIPYQAVARDNSGNPISNQNVSLRFSVHDATANGTVIYTETQSATTNPLGLFTVNIGQGTAVTGMFSSINWGGGSKFIQVELDPTGGTAYVNLGTQQMLSVPYALYSGNSGNGWNISGNAGTVEGINFLGTTDNVPLNFRVNNLPSGRIDGSLANTFFGYKSNTSSTGSSNTAFGYSALNANTSGSDNVAIGYAALGGNTSGSNNIGIGTNTLASNTGNNSVAIGNSALGSNTSGDEMVAIGNGALGRNTTGAGNTSIGSQTMVFNTTGRDNTVLGYRALNSNVSGGSNTAVGTGALFANIDGVNNVAVGDALENNTSGYLNTAIGSEALDGNSTGTFNSSIGDKALTSNITGSYNSAIGFQADVSSGNLINATAIGANASVSQSNSIVLGAISGVNGASNDTKVGIGTTAPHSKLQVTNGDVYLETIATGLILKSPDGNCWRITIDNSGNIIGTSIACP